MPDASLGECFISSFALFDVNLCLLHIQLVIFELICDRETGGRL